MWRRVKLAWMTAAAYALPLAHALAQTGSWPGMELKTNWRGPGFYLSLTKMLLAWLVFLMWVYTTDWVSRDVQEHRKLDYRRWNPVMVGVFVLGMILLWMIPIFWIGWPLLIVAYAAPLTTYVIVRNRLVLPHQRVMTRDHIRHWLASRLGKVGVKMQAEAPDPHETGPPVKVFARGAPTERDNAVRLGLARQSPGLREARRLLAEGLKMRSSTILLDFTQQGTAVRYLIDGVWIDRPGEPREQTDPALESLKILCGVNPQDRVNRQEGQFAAEFEGHRYNGSLISQGTPTGERVLIQFEEKQTPFENLVQLGMREKLYDQFKNLIEQEQSLVIFSAMPGNGLRTTMTVALRGMDRLMRDFAAIEEEGKRYEQVENIPVTTYPPGGALPVLNKLIRAEPHVIVARDLPDKETATRLLQFVIEDKRQVITSIRAKDCAEALLRVAALGVSPSTLAKAATLVINTRLIRKLCECKEAFPPTPEMLKQLGLPAGQVQAFYRPPVPKPDEKREICKKCGGIGYFGRTAIVEMLVVGEAVRQALTTQPKLDVVRLAARKDGMRTLQEEGILLAAKGVTSLQELMRVMKQ